MSVLRSLYLNILLIILLILSDKSPPRSPAVCTSCELARSAGLLAKEEAYLRPQLKACWLRDSLQENNCNMENNSRIRVGPKARLACGLQTF